MALVAPSFWLLEGVFVIRERSAWKEDRVEQRDNLRSIKILSMAMEAVVEVEGSPCSPKALSLSLCLPSLQREESVQ